MKKIKIVLFLLIFVFIFTACDGVAINEIYNKSYNVEEITIEDLEELGVAAVERAEGAVIGVANYQIKNSPLGSNETLVGSGSGVVYKCSATLKSGAVVNDCSTTINRDDIKSYNYYAITNRHVIENGDKVVSVNTTTIRALIGEDDEALAEIVEWDDKVDLAVIKFSHYTYINPIDFADSNKLKKGNFAYAIGSPSGHDYQGSVTFGIISYPKRYMSDDTDNDGSSDWDSEYIQHDVAINPGNSGGALINLRGELIGINTLKFVSSDIDNMGFAIPSNVVREIVSVLETGEKLKRITLGIMVIPVKTIIAVGSPLDPAEYPIPKDITRGLFVESITVGQLAYNHLQRGDIIIKVGDISIKDTKDFRAEIGNYTKGETLKLTVLRDSQERIVSIKL